MYVYPTHAHAQRMERLGIKDGSGFEADGTPPHAASPFPSPCRMRRQQQEEQGGEGQLPPLLCKRLVPFSHGPPEFCRVFALFHADAPCPHTAQLTQEELEDLNYVCERAPDIHSQVSVGLSTDRVKTPCA